jgi:hypothetical protein
MRARLLRWALAIERAYCGLHGHDSLITFKEGRMALRCGSCGWESSGWDCAKPSVVTVTLKSTTGVVIAFASRKFPAA